MHAPCRLAVIASHFIQYQTPLWRELAQRPELELKVYFLSDHGRRPGFDPQFGQTFQWDVPLDEGYDWELLPGGAGVAPLSWQWQLNFGPARLVLSNTADVYLRSDYASPGALAFFYACLAKQAPVLYRGETTLVHEQKGRTKLKRAILGPVFRRKVYALAIGKLAQMYAESLGVPTDRIVLCPYNVDTRYWESAAQELRPQRAILRRAFGLPENQPVVLFCGKVFEIKCPLDLARAMCKLAQRRPVSLLVAGTGEQLAEMKTIVARCPQLTTHFAGFVNQSKLPEVYAAADVLSLPSVSETWGLVVNEAMYFGVVPVVSNRVGCGPDLVDGIGQIHPVGNVDAIVSCLDRVLDELPERKTLVQARIAQYSLDRAVDAIVEATLQAMHSKNKIR